MQTETEKIKRAHRRKSGRTPTAELLALSSNAYKLGGAAKRIYATIRLSVTARDFSRISKAAAFYGLSLSSTARRLLAIGDELDQRKPLNATRLMRFFEMKAMKGTRPTLAKPRRRTLTAADLWARGREGKALYRHTSVNLRLTARNLADIETHRAEGKENGFYYRSKSFSVAFSSLIALALLGLTNLIEAFESGYYRMELPDFRRKPKRQNRNRAYTEAKKRVIEKGYTTEL